MSFFYIFKNFIIKYMWKIRGVCVRIKGDNKLDFSRTSKFSKCKVRITGQDNCVENKGDMSKCCIYIDGNNNHLYIADDVNLCNSDIIITGNQCEVLIGKNSTANGVIVVCMGTNNYVHIGDDCMFADHVELWSSDTHHILDVDGNLLNRSRPIDIGNHVWCARHVKILKGVKVGEGAVIGMGALVTKDVDAYTLNVGSPSKCINRNIKWERDFIRE